MKRRDFIRTSFAAGGALGAEAVFAQNSATISNKEAVAGLFFDVHQFGAKGDGRADDTRAAQDAIIAAIKNKGGRVHFPSGRYRITSSLKIASSDRIEITGDGSSSVLLHENDEPLLLWPEHSMCLESSVRHLCFTSSVNHKSRYTPVIACLGGAGRSLFSHLLFNTAKTGDEDNGYNAPEFLTSPTLHLVPPPPRLSVEHVRMGSGIYVERVMDTTTIEHCLMWGPIRGIGIRVAKGSEVRIIGGRICGSTDPYRRVDKQSIGVHLTENNGGVHLVTTDLIGLGTGLKIGDAGTISNREIFITHATFDSSVHGIVQVDSAYTSISGCWAASSDEEQILMTESAAAGLMMISGGTIYNGGTYGRPGAHHGMVVRAGSFVLNGVAIRNNKGTGLLVHGNAIRDYSVTGCRITDNGVGAALDGENFAVTGNVFSKNGRHLQPERPEHGLVQNNILS